MSAVEIFFGFLLFTMAATFGAVASRLMSTKGRPAPVLWREIGYALLVIAFVGTLVIGSAAKEAICAAS